MMVTRTGSDVSRGVRRRALALAVALVGLSGCGMQATPTPEQAKMIAALENEQATIRAALTDDLGPRLESLQQEVEDVIDGRESLEEAAGIDRAVASDLRGIRDELSSKHIRVTAVSSSSSGTSVGSGSSSESDHSSSIDSSSPSGTVPTRATEVSKDTFKELAHAKNFVDYSKQIESPCGVFGLIVLADRIEFFQWRNGSWNDVSELLGPDGNLVPTTVKSYDFTGDGYFDLFVHYDEPNGSASYGSMFWQDDCVWGWAPFVDSSGDVTYLYEGLAWDEDRFELHGYSYDVYGNVVEIGAYFDSADSMFVVEQSGGVGTGNDSQSASPSSLPYFDSLELWSRSGAVRMLSESVKWSPAWSYGRHLQQGFRAGASAEGGTSVSALGADSVELCIGSRCFAIDDIVVEGGLVYSFSVDGRSIEGSARAWELGEMAFCLDLFDQTCAGSEWSSADLTSIYRFGSSTYVSFELTAGARFSQGIEFSYAKLLDNDGTHSHTGEVVDVVRAGDTSVWMIVFDAVDVSYVPQIELGVSLPGYGQDASYWFAPEKNS